MPSLPFYIVDVFAVGRYSGNPLAVVANAGDLATEIMEAIAREINFSETTFILSDTPKNGGYDVRIFTPTQELPFAGHPTLGTAYIIQQELIRSAVKQVNLNLKVGQIPVYWERDNSGEDYLWMQQNRAEFLEIISPEILAPMLGLNPDDIDDRFPIQVVSTGMDFTIVPLKTHRSLKKCQVNLSLYNEFIQQTEGKEIFVFCPETNYPQNDFSARMFADYLGIPEDPATGSANGCFAAYLVKQNYFNSKSIDARVEQGYEIDRPSLLRLRAQENNGEIAPQVGGQVISISKGEIFV
ncbi:PhzF family phenazine biosynthesis protein [Roseofilum casamattae]|uniref:PhzF family phenazine biosynthesis protein n=1 Tax=Roseofilum casamattae BLCC-M143 TaxID=3022442 RepID=A0ABT7BZJ1_9CYAN|nr:PhzF family phenazine biosynthesis protein [Roseofilum casamattae]MDJ1183846.1 PhzF family phenazine biosynthesis protein [Roseofilum casamattae BLCC-M143]